MSRVYAKGERAHTTQVNNRIFQWDLESKKDVGGFWSSDLDVTLLFLSPDRTLLAVAHGVLTIRSDFSTWSDGVSLSRSRGKEAPFPVTADGSRCRDGWH